MGSRAVWVGAAAAVILGSLHVPAASACGVAYPTGSFVRLSGERTLIVWDAGKKTEHFVRKPTFEGDPAAFGFFVPTPTLPSVAKEDDAVLDRVAALFTPPERGGPSGGPLSAAAAAAGGGSVKVLQRVAVGDFELVSLQATDQNALGDWLSRNHFVDKPAIRAWAKRYVDKAWIINAMRYAGASQRARESFDTPTVRLSFTIDAPFYPYTEVAEDPQDRRAFEARYPTPGCDPNDPLCAGDTPRAVSRPLDVWVVARTPMDSLMGQELKGPAVVDSVRVGGAALASALGDAKTWGFDAASRPEWVVTHLSEDVLVRGAKDDLVFAAYDLPRPRAGEGASAPEGATPPVDLDVDAGAEAKPDPGRKRLRVLAGFVLFVVAAAAGFAVYDERARRPKA